MSQEWNIPCCRASFRSPVVCRSKPTAGILLCWTPLLVPSVSHSASLHHWSITQHLSAISQPCFLPISLLKPLAKGCKHLRSIHEPGIPVVYQYYTIKHPTTTEATGKRLCAFSQPAHITFFVYFLPSFSEPMTSPQSCPVFSDWWVHTKNGLLQPASPTGIKPKLFLKRTLYANTKEKKIALKMLLKCLIQEYCSQLPFQYFRKKSTYLNLRIFNHLTFCTQIHIYTCMYSYIHRYRYI